MTEKENGGIFRKRVKPENFSESERIWMSVKEMGDLLGIRKTDRYWLVHKNVFETSTIRGKMWVNIESFEKWYANQVKYRKVTGEEPGLELKEWSLSPRDIALLLEIPEYRAYELIKEKGWETVTVDFWTRVRRDSFEKWYQSQIHYRTAEDRENDQALEDASLTFPQAAAILGLPRQQLYLILKDKRYSHFFEFVEVAGRRRVTKASFGRFLNGQDRYCVAEKKTPETTEKPAVLSESPAATMDEFKTKEEWFSAKEAPGTFLTIEEAALQSGISPQAISRYAMRGHFGECRKIGGKVRIPGEHFQEWMKKRQEGEMAHGFD
ncbi:MAG: helix-turn-helix domain-containing protein [Parasporobacterium sp.]|nr:helix-turn-helix domain-containing protein [Parasporobacterium sp.]